MKIAVAIPVRNEASSIDELLDSLLTQTRPPDEIVIADGGSTDGTVSRIRARMAKGEPLKLVEIGPAFPGRGRNEAVKATDCEWIAFIDAGIRAAPTWLERLARRADERPELDVLLGNFEPRRDSSLKRWEALAYVPALRATPRATSRASRPGVDVAPQQPAPQTASIASERLASTSHSMDGVGTEDAAARGVARWRGIFIASSLMRRSIWQQAGGFPEHLRSAEDLQFFTAVQAITDKIDVVPEAVVTWDLPATLGRAFHRFRTYARFSMVAGRYDEWNRALVRRYAGLTAVASLTGPLAPLLWSGAVAAQLVARSVRASWAKPEFVEPRWSRRPTEVVATAAVLGVIDAAALMGTLDWARGWLRG